ncbi:MAG: tryptophan--tRNA ligase [Methanobacteriota archaeon]
MVRIDPWSSAQYADYARLRDEFGIEPFTFHDSLPDPPPIFSRGVVFGHRGFDRVVRAQSRSDPWAVLTGLMPSGRMHLGHKMVIDQVAYYQSLGADVTLAVADLEAYATRSMSLSRCAELARDEYVANYLALGLSPENFRLYFQSRRQAVKNVGFSAARKVNWGEMRAIYGFEESVNMAHVMSPLVQVGDILHVQLPEYGGPRPTVVPVGVDQDPHLRLTRDLAAATRLFSVQDTKEGVGVFVKAEKDFRNVLALAERFVPDAKLRAKLLATPDEAERNQKLVKELFRGVRAALKEAGFADLKENLPYNAIYVPAAGRGDLPLIDEALARVESEGLGEPGFVLPAATYHRFMSGLTGEKMSSSKPETSIFLTDDAETAKKRIGNAKTGGRATAEEQRRLGAEWDKCTVAELYTYHLAPDDDDLKEKYDKCTSGERLCGPCKGIATERAQAFLKGHQEKYAAMKDEAARIVKDALTEGSA